MTLPFASRLLVALAAIACVAATGLARPPAAAAGTSELDVSATVRLVPGRGATLAQRGTFVGSPVGRGSIRLSTRLGQGSGAVFSFVMSTRRGTLRGSGSIALDFRGSTVSYSGTASITQGTGAFARYRARGLHVSGRELMDADKFRFRMTGRVTY
jgi:hypothetical protein